jgi:hypothetical protein
MPRCHQRIAIIAETPKKFVRGNRKLADYNRSKDHNHITLCGIVAVTKSPCYHGAFAVFYLVYNLALRGSNLLRLI